MTTNTISTFFLLLLTVRSPLFSQEKIPPNSNLITYEGARFSVITAEKATLNRHTPEVYTHNESGYGDSWTNSVGLARTQTGVRLRFKTASPTVQLNFKKRTDGYVLSGVTNPINGFTVFCNGAFLTSYNDLEFTVTNPRGAKSSEYEVTLPNLWAVDFYGLSLESGSTLEPMDLKIKPVYGAIGNSITHGTGQYCATADTYPYLLAKKMGWNLHNFAVAGAMTGWATALNMKGYPVDYITVLIGFNDWKYQKSSLDSKKQMYSRLIDSLRVFQPNATIYCISPLTTTEKDTAAPYSIQAFRTMVKEVVSTRISSGDKKLFFIHGPDISDETMLASGDPVHLSVSGAKRLADNLASKIDTSLVPDTLIDTSNGSVNYATIPSAWDAFTDNLGSKVISLEKQRPITVKFSVVPKPSPNEWPWASLVCSRNINFSGVKTIKIGYTSSTPLIVSLPQPVLNEVGESYAVSLPASTTKKVVYLRISSFSQPSGSTNNLPLDLTKVESVAINPINQEVSIDGISSVSVDELVVFSDPTGTIPSSSTKPISAISINTISRKSVHLSIPEPGDYSVSLHTLTGRSISLWRNMIVQKGDYTIPLEGLQLAKQTVILSIQSLNTSLSRCISIR